MGTKKIIILCCAFLFADEFCENPAFAQTVVEDVPMTFATFTVSPGGGTITLQPNGGTVYSNIIAVSGSLVAAQATVSGLPLTAFVMTYPAQASMTGGVGTVTLDNFTDDAPATTDIGGNATFNIGARLNADYGTSGSFSGNFLVTVNYN